MNAELAWNLWRRILREDALQAALFAADFKERAPALGLSPEERDIAAEYARMPVETRWAIDTYRFRLSKVILEALYMAAPLTNRLLQSRGVDLDLVARDYLQTVGWRDEGPYTYRTCAGMLAFLDGTLGERDPELRDLMAFEGATVGLLRALAGQEIRRPPDEPGAVDAGARFVQTGRAVVVTTRFDLMPWIRDHDAIGASPLEPKELTFLRYLRSTDEDPALLALRARSLAIYAALAVPRSPSMVADLLGDEADPIATTIGRFVGLGIVTRSEVSS